MNAAELPNNVTPLTPRLDPQQETIILLKAIAASNPPNWQRPLRAYKTFDWSKLGATVLSSDQHGATQISWCGHVYSRRAGENKKFGAAIWFSRGNGRGEDGEASYVRLITFKNSEVRVEPLPDYVARAL
jgi:hypothetical protein